ncbi:hypothetical protein [Zavarzinia sp. CC-PAN008]|uniref:hypothetical protein n=1 Tax=Zavarzinia sp. CC-PAN008 TaxID=3243332 RepID=UPI003F748268
MPASLRGTGGRETRATERPAEAEVAAPEVPQSQGGDRGPQEQTFPVFLDPNVRLRVEYDKDAERFVYFGVNVDSGEVIVQYPQDEVLRRIQASRSHLGLSLDKQV